MCVVMSAGGDSLMDSFTGGFLAASIIRVPPNHVGLRGDCWDRVIRKGNIMNWRLRVGEGDGV